MTDTKMLQILVDGQVDIKKQIKKGQNELKEKINNLDDKLTKHIDALGNQLNVLDEDVPTGEEFKQLGTRVDKIEKQIASN